MKAIVVGTGAGSLASALRLRRLGCEVELFEACPDAGGRARTLNLHGYDFDAGPTVITAPWLFDELFELFGERREDHIEFLPCNPWYRLSFPDGASLDLVADITEQERQIAQLSQADAKSYRRYLAHTHELYRVGYEELGDADFTRLGAMFQTIPQLFKLGAFRSLWSHTARYFTDRRVRQAFSLQTLLVGGDPTTTTAIYALIHAMERKGGIWFAQGGTGNLVRQLRALGERHGIRFRFNAKVTGYTLAEGRRLDGVTFLSDGAHHRAPCNLCVWGGDPVTAYSLLPRSAVSLVERIRLKTAQLSMGLYVLYFKTTKRYSECAHHTILLSARWEELLREIFHGSALPPDPSLYLHRPASTDPSFDCPDGDLFYVLAPVPHLGKFSQWQDNEPSFRRVVLEILQERMLPDLVDSLQFAEAIDPRYFKDTLGSHNGSGFSLAPTLQQSAWFRFHNRADKVPNLYLCGAGVHPGGGLPGVVTSAKVIERLVRRDYGERVTNSLQIPRIESRQPDVELCA